MKDRKPSRAILRELCGEIRDDDGVDPRESKKEERNNKMTSRDWQLCAQVRRCLLLAVPEALYYKGIPGAEVVSVEPAPDASRLSIMVSVDSRILTAARETIPRIRGQIRDEAARAVHRKRVPELAIEIVAAKAVDDV